VGLRPPPGNTGFECLFVPFFGLLPLAAAQHSNLLAHGDGPSATIRPLPLHVQGCPRAPIVRLHRHIDVVQELLAHPGERSRPRQRSWITDLGTEADRRRGPLRWSRSSPGLS
jgi:hypothetical protein